jgi:hypothetical protein
MNVNGSHTYDKGFNKFKPDMSFEIREPSGQQAELELDA